MLVVRHLQQVGSPVAAALVCSPWEAYQCAPGELPRWAAVRAVPAQGTTPAHISLSRERFSTQEAAQVEAWRRNSAEYAQLLARLGLVCAQVGEVGQQALSAA